MHYCCRQGRTKLAVADHTRCCIAVMAEAMSASSMSCWSRCTCEGDWLLAGSPPAAALLLPADEWIEMGRFGCDSKEPRGMAPGGWCRCCCGDDGGCCMLCMSPGAEMGRS